MRCRGISRRIVTTSRPDTVPPTFTTLPPLPFGAAASHAFSNVATFGDALAPFVEGLQAVESAGPGSALRARMSGVQVRDVGLMSCVSTAGRAVVGANDQLVFGFSRSGDVSYVTDSGTYRGIRSDHFLVGDSCPRTVVIHEKATLFVVVLDRERLLRTADAMIGDPSAAGRPFGRGEGLLPRRGCLLPLNAGRAARADIFSGIFHMIDAVRGDPPALAAMALDDHVHRLLVMMLRPEALASGHGRTAGTRQAEIAVDKACGFIDGHLTSPITLTHLEEVTGMGARALQLAFRNRFGCSPMVWVRRRRLERVRSEFQSGDAPASVREVAVRYGFLQEGHFARIYRLQFGELPSETLARRRG